MEEYTNAKKVKEFPNNFEAEKSLLGCILIDKEVSDRIVEELDEQAFYNDFNRLIYKGMIELKRRNENIDIITVNDLLEKEQSANETTLQYLTSLADDIVSTSFFNEYANILRRDHTLRKVITACNSIIKDAYTSSDANAVLQNAEKLIYDISKTFTKSDLTHIGEASGELLKKIEAMIKDKFAFRGLHTGFKIFDRKTNGLQKGDLLVLAARPSVGKTSIALNFIANIVKNSKDSKNVAVFSLEMPAIQLAQRLIANIGSIKMSDISKGEILQDGSVNLWAAHQKLSDSKVYVDDSSLVKPGEILTKCRRLSSQIGGLDLILVDYLQLMSGESKNNDNRQQDISYISRMMKILAKEMNAPVIIISQMSRGIENRRDKTPKLSDLRESGAIEQDADIVAFLSRENDEEKDGAVILDIAKHRNGELFKVRLDWTGEFIRFEESSDQEIKVNVISAESGGMAY